MFGKLIGGFLQSKNPEHAGDLIKLEDEEFEKQFAVYGTDQIELRYILTPKMMQDMTALQSKIKLPMHFSLKENTFTWLSQTMRIYLSLEYLET